MSRFGLPAAAAAILLAGTSAWAGPVPGSGGLLPAKPLVMPQSLLPPPKPQPNRYPMTFSENVARSLGVEEGRLNLSTAPRNPYMPRLSVDGGMLRLRWRP
jgi:hypothetical protein